MDDDTREKAWDLAEFVVDTIIRATPDWFALELCARELAELAAEQRPAGH